LSREAGLMGYLGTNDLTEVFHRIDAGDNLAANVYRAMVQQIVKELGAMAAVLKGQVARTIITGGMAKSERLCADLKAGIAFIAPVDVLAGSLELEALAQGVWRVLNGNEEARQYV
ncbi:MAG: butyrate kinase, partial [Candidatus Marinimicrobia bacterium]|nr:butyrate kinase [Candidatus Neomarinimicrobiota bacterium]